MLVSLHRLEIEYSTTFTTTSDRLAHNGPIQVMLLEVTVLKVACGATNYENGKISKVYSFRGAKVH